MEWKIRHPRVEEFEEILDLVDGVFKKTEREYFELFVPDRTSFPHNAFVAEIDGKIVAFLQVFERYVRTKDGVLKMGGIGNVSTTEKFRGKGIASSLLQKAYEHMKENGFDISVLFASRKSFYTRNGWRVLPTLSTVFKIEGNGIDGIKDLETSNIDTEVRGWIEKLYDDFNNGVPLTVVRDAHVWNLELSYWKRRLRFIDGKAYVIYSSYGGKIVIEDCAFYDEEAMKIIFKSFGGEIIFQGFEWHPAFKVLDSISHEKKSRILEEVYVREVNSAVGFDKDWHYWRFDYF